MKAIISVYNSSYIHEKHKSRLKTLIQQLFAHSIDDREFAENAFKTIIFRNEKYLGLVELVYLTAFQDFSFCQNNSLDIFQSNFYYLNDNHN